jgi:CoA:oxalate CoA-transferase
MRGGGALALLGCKGQMVSHDTDGLLRHGAGMSDGHLPLADVRVLDLSQAAAGPICAEYLAFLGADVIKVEPPKVGDMARQTPPYGGGSGVVAEREAASQIATTVLKRNRNKRGITLNLREPAGAELAGRLAGMSDVLIENYRPGVLTRLGLGYHDVAAKRPEIIYCSITGFGWSGPYRDWAAFDETIQAMSGLMALTGPAGGSPTKTGIILADQVAPLFAAMSILAALRTREASGRGQFLEVSMFDCLLSLVWDEPIEYLSSSGRDVRVGNRLQRMAPWNTYPVRDGWIVICIARSGQWERLAEIMGRSDLSSDPRFDSVEHRLANVDALDAEIAAWTGGLSRREVVECCQRRGVPCGPVNELPDLLMDPQVKYREILQSLPHPTEGRVRGATAAVYPVRFSGQAPVQVQPAPMLGEHNREILVGLLGLSDGELADLSSAGVV